MDRFRRRMAMALIIMTAGTLLSSFLYSGGYNYFRDPISALGKTVTDEGLTNTASQIMFTATCLASSALLFSACSGSFKWTILAAASGLLFMPLPCNLYPLGHQISSGIAVGGAYFYCSLYLFRTKVNRIWILIYQASVLIYAYMHISGSVLKEEFQTFAVAAIILTMLSSTRAPRVDEQSALQIKSPNP